MEIILGTGLAIGAASLAGAAVYLVMSNRLMRARELAARLDVELRNSLDRLTEIRADQQGRQAAFEAAAAQALRNNNQSFLELASSTFARFQSQTSQSLEANQLHVKTLVEPLQHSLSKVDEKIEQLERTRAGAYQGLSQHLSSLVESQRELRNEAQSLSRALRAPSTRGRWGEIQLKRVVELAGMLDHCDFFEQAYTNQNDTIRRPDMIIRLPGDKTIVIDAKTPLAAYLEAHESSIESHREQKLLEHAANLRRHIQILSQKSYWEQFKDTPEFVVLFIPGEQFFGAALEKDPALIEIGVDQRVIIATPTTLIALLRAVAYGWRQESITQNAREISDLGKQLYARLSDMAGHLSDLGRSVASSVKSYNKAIGSFESRVMVSARKFEELKSHDATKTLAELTDVELWPRALQADRAGGTSTEV